MNAPLDIALTETMQQSLKSFFLSLQGDGTALKSFLGTWSTFNETIRSNRDRLQGETVVAIHNFASIIETVVADVLELEKTTERILQENATDISRILDEEMGNLTISDKPNRNTSGPAYMKLSYEWLLSHLYSPYPSKEMKKDISRRTNCSVKDIDSWFIDARKRIGWNKLRRTHFSNKQENIIAAAARFFNPAPLAFKDDLSGNCESEMPSYDYHKEFTALEDAARSLYSGRFADSTSLNALLDSVKEAPAVITRTSAKRTGGHKRTRSSQSKNSDLVSSYPTPEPSPWDFVEPSLPSTPISASYPLPTHSRKRRQSSSDVSDEDAEESQARPQKRSRFDTPESTEIAAVASLPSPANTIDLSEDTTEDCQLLTEPTAPEPGAVDEAPRTKRKRRLSDGDDPRQTKRPHNALSVPRLQTVSDPFPIAKSFEGDSFNEWFQGIFTAERQLSHAIPSPTNLEVPDSLDAVPLDVHFHQYDFSPYHPEIPLLEEPLAGHENVTPGASLSPSAVSKSTETLEETTGCEALSFSDHLLQGGVTGLSFDLDYNSLPTPFPGTNFQTSFDPVDILSFDVFDQPTTSDFPWTSSHLSLPLSDAYDVESFPSFNIKTPVFSNFNATVRQDLPSTEDQDAKRARAEILREELRRIEAEIAP